jgi:phosphatidylglycerophosphate synthase
VVLTALGVTIGLDAAQWVTGAVLGAAVTGLVVHCARRSAHTPAPADLVTFVRCMLACAVAALLVHGDDDRSVVQVAVAVAVVALLTDLVDGRVARRTGTTAFGGRFDGEADAFLILVLALHVASTGPTWVLLIGAIRYLFGAGELWVAWFRLRLPPRYWRKVAAAVQGVVLTAVAADVLPPVVEVAALVLALGLLVESFGRDLLWLWRRRGLESVQPEAVVAGAPARVDPTVASG